MDGILIVNKPRGITSFQVVRLVRKLTKLKKVGHGGTLDPLAEGVLPILLGRATKKADFFLDGDKGYVAEMILGITTDTFDSDGKITSENLPVNKEQISIGRIVDVFNMFTGEILQVPPMYSAKHHKGQRLYKLARMGKTVERKPKKINIRKIELIDYHADNPPKVSFAVYCSKGTYIRSLVSDMGQELGCGAHLGTLIRTYSHPFVISQALSIETVEDLVKAGKLDSVILDADDLLSGIQGQAVNG